MDNLKKNLNYRIIIILLVMGITYIVLQKTASVQTTPILKSLETFPEQIGSWKKVNSLNLSEESIDLLGVDDYINYNYISENGNSINLYISYFQALGVTGVYHSPLNCLPGGGLRILDKSTIKIANGTETIRKLILKQNGQTFISYYWYYDRGRTISSEYLQKIYVVIDALFKGRRDGAFIRIICYPDKNGKYDSDEIFDFINKAHEISTHFLPGKELSK